MTDVQKIDRVDTLLCFIYLHLLQINMDPKVYDYVRIYVKQSQTFHCQCMPKNSFHSPTLPVARVYRNLLRHCFVVNMFHTYIIL